MGGKLPSSGIERSLLATKQTSGIEASGTETRRILPSSIESGGIETRGSEMSGIVPRGIEKNGIETSGIEPRGIETSGNEAIAIKSLLLLRSPSVHRRQQRNRRMLLLSYLRGR